MTSNLLYAADSGDEATAAERRLMAELCIVPDGRCYGYGGYRYERLADAVAYAELLRDRNPRATPSPAVERSDARAPLSMSERLLMLELAISFENGSFVFNGFRYDNLIDAANYARHVR